MLATIHSVDSLIKSRQKNAECTAVSTRQWPTGHTIFRNHSPNEGARRICSCRNQNQCLRISIMLYCGSEICGLWSCCDSAGICEDVLTFQNRLEPQSLKPSFRADSYCDVVSANQTHKLRAVIYGKQYMTLQFRLYRRLHLSQCRPNLPEVDFLGVLLFP